MATLALTEQVDSREITDGPNPSVIFHYILTGTADDVAAKAYVRRRAPIIYEGLSRKTMEVNPAWVDTVADDGLWEVAVRYDATIDPFEIGDFSETFDISLATEHITHSIETVGKYASGNATAPDLHQAINDTGERIEGVDIFSPVYRFEETHRLSSLVITPAYKGAIFHLSRKINSSRFKGFEPGECMFIGARGRRAGTDDWEVQFRFACIPNRYNITIDRITVPEKRGWDYMWVKWTEGTNDDRGAQEIPVIVKIPLAVYVERNYDYRSFSVLRIGT